MLDALLPFLWHLIRGAAHNVFSRCTSQASRVLEEMNMTDDIKIEGLNISALERNFETLKKIVLEQRDIIKTQEKDLRLCFSRIDSLNGQLNKKHDNPLAGLFGA